ncbi:hypothetical protein BDZ89DRAFT_972315, partial [Hymenopellis radicata]
APLPRPMNGFLLFRRYFYKAENGTAEIVSKRAGAIWNTLSKINRDVWLEHARARA